MNGRGPRPARRQRARHAVTPERCGCSHEDALRRVSVQAGLSDGTQTAVVVATCTQARVS